jgi:hypothetical protein
MKCQLNTSSKHYHEIEKTNLNKIIDKNKNTNSNKVQNDKVNKKHSYLLIGYIIYVITVSFFFMISVAFALRQKRLKSIKYKVDGGLNNLKNKENYEHYFKNYINNHNSYNNSKSYIFMNNDFNFFEKLYLSNDNNYHVPYYEKIILDQGYNFERHKIITEDGYINTAWRITSNNFNKNLTPVIINHGLLDNSFTFMAMGKNYSLPYLLADQGFEIWMTNNRGTVFSYEHLIYDSFQINSPYWEFTVHELSKYDLPANIEYVKNVTGFSKVNYIGHSQGGFMMILGHVMNSEYYNQNILNLVTLGTVPKFIEIVSYLIFN